LSFTKSQIKTDWLITGLNLKKYHLFAKRMPETVFRFFEARKTNFGYDLDQNNRKHKK
jgi:hypothetical protein